MTVYNSLIEALAKIGGIKDWTWVHVKIGMPGDKKHEIYFSNPDYVVFVQKPEEALPQPIEPPAPPEALQAKIKRFRNAKLGELKPDEEAWFKERQKELETNKIGQIQPEDSMIIAMAKLKQIGLEG